MSTVPVAEHPLRRFLPLLMLLCLLLAASPLAAYDETAHPVPVEDPDTGLWGYADESGSVVIEPSYTLAGEFLGQGVAPVLGEDGWRWIDLGGKVLAEPFLFDNWPDEFSQGLARIVRDGKMGFMDEAGAIAIEPVWDFADPFANGQATVCTGCERVYMGEHWTMEGGQWGCIDQSGELAAPLSDQAPDCGR